MKSFTTWLSLSNYPRSHPGEMLKALQIQLRCQKLMETYGLIACGILMYCRCPISECNHLRNSHVLTGTLLYFSNIQDVSQTPRGDNLWGQSSKGSFATLQPQNHQNPQIPKVQSTVFWWQNPYWTSILTVCFFFGWQTTPSLCRMLHGRQATGNKPQKKLQVLAFPRRTTGCFVEAPQVFLDVQGLWPVTFEK